MDLELLDLFSRVTTYCKSSSSSLSFVDSSYRRNGLAELRHFTSQLLQLLASQSFHNLSCNNCCEIIKHVLLLLWPPFTLTNDRLDALPLPFIQPPLPPPSHSPPSPPHSPFSSLSQQECRLSSVLRARSFLSKQSSVPLAFDCIAPTLSSHRRSESAFRAAAAISRGDSSSSSASAATNSNSSVHRLNDNSFLFSWAMQAPLALDLIRVTLLILIQQVETDINKLSSLALIFDSSLFVNVVCSCSHFLCYTPWTFPDAHKSAQKVVSLLSRLCVLLRKEKNTDSSSNVSLPLSPSLTSFNMNEKSEEICIPISQMKDLHYIVGIHADALLEYCRRRSVGGQWKSEALNEPIRFLTVLVVSSLRILTPDRLSLCIPLGLRLSDDPDPENTWLGASMLCHILSVALPTDLRTHPFCSPLIKEAVERADVCGSIRQHPTVAHVLSHLSALSLVTLYGTPEQLCKENIKGEDDDDELVRHLSKSPLPPQQSCLDRQYDVAVYSLLKKLSLSSSSHVQFVVLDAFGNVIVAAIGSQIARHLSRLVPALVKLVTQTGDARVAAAALSVLNECILAAPSRFCVSREELDWIMLKENGKNNDDNVNCLENVFMDNNDDNDESLLIDALSRRALAKTVIDTCSFVIERIKKSEEEIDVEGGESGSGYGMPREDNDGGGSWNQISGNDLVKSWRKEVQRKIQLT